MKGTSFHTLYQLLRPELRPRLASLAGVIALAALSAFGEKAPLLLLKPLFDRVLFPEAANAAPTEQGDASRAVSSTFADIEQRLAEAVFGPTGAATTDEQRVAALWTVAILILVLTAISAFSQYALTWLSRWVALRMIVDLRMRLARHILGLSMRFHGERRFGDVLSRVSSDVTHTLSCINMSLKDLTQQPLMIAGSLTVAAIAAPLPTLVVLVFMPLVIVPIAKLGKKVRKRSTKTSAQLGASVHVLTQAFTGIRTVKAFRAEERELERYRRVNEEYLHTAMRATRAVAMIQGATTLLSNLGLAALLLVVGGISLHQRLFASSGDMLVFFTGISMIYTHAKRITSGVNHVQESAGAAVRLCGLLEERADIVEREDARAIGALGRGIEFERVSFTYPGTAEPALSDLTLHVRPGETLALVGPSGAGKSTLIDLIARFIDASSGAIRADGIDLRELSLDSWTRMYAMVGQVPFVFHASLRENILYGKPDATQAEIEAAARAAHIHDFIASLPQGYDTVVGDAGSRLSGGQRQRITIARAILKGAPLLLLDEATSALDSESEAAVQEALEALMKDRTVIVIAHRLSTVRNADRIAVLDKGRLVELGTHDELIARGGSYARLHAAQFREEAAPSAAR